MKKNTTDFLPWENNFSPAEQQTLKSSDWNHIADGATPPGWIPDSPKAVATWAADYERLFDTSLTEDLKKYFTWLVLILAFTSAFFWQGRDFYQNDPNPNDRAALLNDVSGSPGDTLLEANPTETPPGTPLGKMPPGTTKNKNTQSSQGHYKFKNCINMDSIQLALPYKFLSALETYEENMDKEGEINKGSEAQANCPEKLYPYLKSVPNTICIGINFFNLASANTKDSTVLLYYAGHGFNCGTDSFSQDVTTIDLNLINKHLLGTKPLENISQAIAADVDFSDTITREDVTTLRKTILGIYNGLPENRKWGFIDKNDVSMNYTDQFAAYAHRNNLSFSNTTESNLIRLRIGDVDKTVPSIIKNTNRNKDSLYVFLVTTDAYNTGEHPLSASDSVKANQVFKVTFKGLAKTQGYQFTLDHPGLELIDILPGQYMGLDNFGVFADKSAVTTSWNGDVLPEFSIKFKAKQVGKLDHLLSVSSRITKAVAYRYTDAEVLEVALRYPLK